MTTQKFHTTMTERQWTLHTKPNSTSTSKHGSEKDQHCEDEKNSSSIPIEQIKCKKEACAIQYCFKRHSFSEDKCRSVILEWQTCAARARRKQQEEKQQQQQNHQ
jgi:Mature-T-Cell Proliferation I type